MMKAQQNLIDMEEQRPQSVDDVWELAQEFAKQLLDEQTAALEDEQRLRDYRGRIERIVRNTTILVANARIYPPDADPNDTRVEGKLRYTNDTQRKAAVEERLDNDPEHRRLQAEVWALELEQRLRNLRIEYIDNMRALFKLKYEGMAIGRRHG